MDSVLSPDFEAYWCYLVVFALALIVAAIQVRGLLKGFANIWATTRAWLLLAAYTAVPVALFWLLDRADALHDTSLFAAVLVAVTYRQILTGGASGTSVPGGFAKAWQPFVTWSDNVAAGIRNRIARNNRQYDDNVIRQLATNAVIFDKVRNMILNRSAEPAKIQAAINDLDTLRPPLDDAGVQERKAGYLYYKLKALTDVDSDRELRDLGVISPLHYYLYAREWSSKLFVISVIAVAALAIASWSWTHWNDPPVYRAWYYVWRFEKPNSTAVDRFRAAEQLEKGLRDGNPTYAETVRRLLTSKLGFEMLPVDTADRILKLLLNQSLVANSVPLIDELADALRTDNSDLRSRIQKELLYVGDERRLPIPSALRNWNPGKEDTPTCIDTVANAWTEIARTRTVPEVGTLVCLGTPAPPVAGPAGVGR